MMRSSTAVRRGEFQIMPESEPIKVDPNPTPQAEAEQFENPDERERARANAHELALLSAKKGWIGRITGSTNEDMNTGLFVLLISLLLCEGSSMRAISRICDVSINTVSKLLVDAGRACAAFHDEKVRGVVAKRIQCDEIWAFTHCKQRRVATAKAPPLGAGDTWTWTGICTESKRST
jgi:hypothetical protein